MLDEVLCQRTKKLGKLIAEAVATVEGLQSVEAKAYRDEDRDHLEMVLRLDFAAADVELSFVEGVDRDGVHHASQTSDRARHEICDLSEAIGEDDAYEATCTEAGIFYRIATEAWHGISWGLNDC